MGLRNQYSKSATLKRLSVTGDKEDYASNSTITVHMQPSASETVALIDGDYSKTLTIYVDQAVDILVSDQLTIDSIVYYVRGLKNYDIGSASMQHKEVVIEKKNV